jgi:hypothetical protein
MNLRPVSAIVLALTVAACSSKDDPAGPGPSPVPPTIESFFVSTGGSVRHGDTARLIWNAPNAETASIGPGIGTVSPASDGSVTIRPPETTTYTLTVQNSVGSATANLTVPVNFIPGLYVNSTTGDDSRDGATPPTAIRTLGEALDRVGSGGSIFLTGAANPANATYAASIDLDGEDVSIYGGRDPATFFEGEGNFPSTIRPTSGTPLVVRNTFTTLQYFDVVFDASNGGDHAVLVDAASAMFERCTFDATNCASGAAIALQGTARVSVNACRVQGGRDRTYLQTAGVRTSSSSELSITNCFVDGGRAIDLSSGIEARGIVNVGFNTILVEVAGQGLDRNAACVRIVEGNPALGGNIFMGQGSGRRLGVIETAPGTNPSFLEGNLFVSVGVPPYINADGESPEVEAELNDERFTTNNANTVGGNYWSTEVGASALFESLSNGNFHLVDPIPGGGSNPAVDQGDSYLAKDAYGWQYDIDGDRRPTTNSGRNIDLGADEL